MNVLKNKMKKLIFAALGLTLAVGVLTGCESEEDDVIVLRVSNWEEYMDEGDWDEEEAQYGLISKKQPLYEKSSNKNCHYQIDDCFFRFWFRFVYRHQDLVEMNQLEELRRIVQRDFDVFSGLALERYFHWKFVCEKRYVRMGGWWDRKGENEIDLVCEKSDGGFDVYEVKRDKARISLSDLMVKTDAFLRKNSDLKGREMKFLPLSLADM